MKILSDLIALGMPPELAELVSPAYAIPQYFGAKGDGSHDDTTAIQDTIDSLDSRGGTVCFPPGVYKITSALTLTSYINLLGAGMNASRIHQAATDGSHILSYADPGTVSDDSVRYCGVSDLYLTGNSSSGDGIHVEIPFGFYADHVRVEDCGGIGMVFRKDPNGTGQSVYITRSVVRVNKGGGIKLDSTNGGNDMGHIVSTIMNENGKYGVYLSKQVLFQIRDSEFAGYDYGRIVAGQTACAICMYGGEGILIEGNSFEAGGGQVGGPSTGYYIRTGFNGEAQTEPNDTNTLGVTIRNNVFKAVGGASGDLNQVKVHWVKNISLDDNIHEKSGTYTGSVTGILYGTQVGGGKIVLKNPSYNGTLDANTSGATAPATLVTI